MNKIFNILIQNLFGFLGMACLFYASSNAHQADVAIISKLSPFIVTVIVVNPSMISNALPLFMAFLAAVTSSGSYVLLAYFNNRVNGMTVIVHFSAVCIAITIPFMCFNLTNN